MSQIKVKDADGEAIILLNIRLGINSQDVDSAYDDRFTDYAGATAWPNPLPSSNGYSFFLNYRNELHEYESKTVSVDRYPNPTTCNGGVIDGPDHDILVELASIHKPLEDIHIDGDILRTSNGNQLIIAGTSNYMLAQLKAEGVNIVERLHKGPNFARLFMTHSIISGQVGMKAFHPDQYGMTDWLIACEDAIDICNANSQYVQANLICDNQLFGKDVSYLRDLQNRFIEMFKTKKGIYSLGNENAFNGFNANDFSKPSGVISACGSGGTGFEAPLSNGQAWDLQHQHLRRDEKMFIDIPPVDAPTYHLNHKVIFDETIGFANYDDAGRRSKNADWAYKIGRIASAFNGAIIHIENGSHSNLLNGEEQNSVDAFVEGSRR